MFILNNVFDNQRDVAGEIALVCFDCNKTKIRQFGPFLVVGPSIRLYYT